MVNGIPQTTLLFVEYSRNKTTLPPKSFTIQGNQVHLDAMVIKFDRDFVKQNDPLRGHSIALFTKLFGNHQSPDNGSTIDTPGQIPNYYQGIDPRVSQFESDLWKNFWQLTKGSRAAGKKRRCASPTAKGYGGIANPISCTRSRLNLTGD